MSALTRSFFLAWRKPRLSKQVSIQKVLKDAKRILIRLAEHSPHTLFSIYAAASLKNGKRKRKITVIAQPDAEVILSTFNGLFAEKILLDSTPTYGSKTFKSLKEKLLGSNYDVFADLDPLPLPELAVLSEAKLRIAYDADKLFPYFNLLFNLSKDADMRKRTLLMTRCLAGEDHPEKALPKPNISQRKVEVWLKKNGYKQKGVSFFLTSLPLTFDTVKDIPVFGAGTWENEPVDVKMSIFASAKAYIGKPDLGFELAYLSETPSVLVLSGEKEKTSLPSSPLVKPIVAAQGILSPETIEQTFTRLL